MQRKELAIIQDQALTDKDISFRKLVADKKDCNKTGSDWKLKLFGPEKAQECIDQGIHSARALMNYNVESIVNAKERKKISWLE